MSYLEETVDGEGRKRRIWIVRRGRNSTPKIKRKRQSDGAVVTEHVTAKPFRRFVNSKGDVVQVCMTAGAADRNGNSPYANHRIRTKMRDGFVPADECAMANGQLPPGLRRKGDKPCEGWVDEYGMAKRVGSPRKPVEPCEHTQRIIEARKARSSESKSARKEKRRGMAEKNSEAMFRLLKQLESKSGSQQAPKQAEL